MEATQVKNCLTTTTKQHTSSPKVNPISASRSSVVVCKGLQNDELKAPRVTPRMFHPVYGTER